jgi:hypothetical protein
MRIVGRPPTQRLYSGLLFRSIQTDTHKYTPSLLLNTHLARPASTVMLHVRGARKEAYMPAVVMKAFLEELWRHYIVLRTKWLPRHNRVLQFCYYYYYWR